MNKADFIKKYGSVKVSFSSYFKYSFVYEGVLLDGQSISCTIKGDSGGIYDIKVDARAELTIRDLDPDDGHVYLDDQYIEGFSNL